MSMWRAATGSRLLQLPGIMPTQMRITADQAERPPRLKARAREADPAQRERFLLDLAAYLHDREAGTATSDEQLAALESHGPGPFNELRLQNGLTDFANAADPESAQRGVQAAPFLETTATIVILG